MLNCRCIELISVDCRDGSTSAVQLIPRLWPFLGHNIRSVRRAALRTMSVLLTAQRLKVVERELLFDKILSFCMYGFDFILLMQCYLAAICVTSLHSGC